MTRRQQQPRQQRRIVPALPGREVLPPRRAGACLAPCPQGGARVGAAPCPQDAPAALQLCVGCQSGVDSFCKAVACVTSRSPPDSWFLVTVTVKRVTRGVLHSVHVKLPSRQDAQPPVPWSVETHPGLEGATMNQAQHKEHKRAHSVSTGARTSHRPDETQGVQGQGAAARRSAGFDYPLS